MYMYKKYLEGKKVGKSSTKSSYETVILILSAHTTFPYSHIPIFIHSHLSVCTFDAH